MLSESSWFIFGVGDFIYGSPVKFLAYERSTLTSFDKEFENKSWLTLHQLTPARLSSFKVEEVRTQVSRT